MSSPMIPWRPIVNSTWRLFRYLTTSDDTALWIDLPSVKIYDVETSPEKSARTLKHLLKANHINNALLYHNLIFHNHVPYGLGSAYIMGADGAHLEKFYTHELKELEPWKDSPAEITDKDWRNFVGDRRYYRAYVDFFEDELALKFSYDWKVLIREYLYSGKEPLINGMIGGLGHPLIHLAYAYELNSREVGIEAIAMTASTYTFLHKYMDKPTYTRPSTYTTTSPLEILHKIHEDKRFDGILSDRGSGNFKQLFNEHEDLILEHWNAWTIKDPKKQFEESQEAAIALLVHTVDPGTHAYDFFLLHLLTTSHSIRILLFFIPKKFHVNLLRQWFLLVVASYIAQMRPKINTDVPEKPTKQWNYVEHKAIDNAWCLDSHYIKAIRAIREAAFTWGDVHEWYLAAAIKFADDFNGWTGWGPAGEDYE